MPNTLGLHGKAVPIVRKTVLAWLPLSLALMLLGGCSSVPPSAPVSQRPSDTPVVSTAPSAVSASRVASDALAMIGREGGDWVASSEPSKLDAAAAISKAAFVSLEASTPVVSATKVRLTDVAVANRLVWVVAASPVIFKGHGPAGANKSPVGREVIVIDAQTGAALERFGWSL